MLFDEIKLGYPALWLKTTEFSRAAESLISYDFRDFYTIDFESAFSKYVDGSWNYAKQDDFQFGTKRQTRKSK